MREEEERRREKVLQTADVFHGGVGAASSQAPVANLMNSDTVTNNNTNNMEVSDLSNQHDRGRQSSPTSGDRLSGADMLKPPHIVAAVHPLSGDTNANVNAAAGAAGAGASSGLRCDSNVEASGAGARGGADASARGSGGGGGSEREAGVGGRGGVGASPSERSAIALFDVESEVQREVLDLVSFRVYMQRRRSVSTREVSRQEKEGGVMLWHFTFFMVLCSQLTVDHALPGRIRAACHDTEYCSRY